ncbi:hypothetical protein PUN28_020031 [Cardiocondyla obscurior]|uniref:Uncharacterized protein n=1 Tax=Cardiocondyla obscurior TaxID=286306 RepID=A0AAW2EBI6_9HYME
MRARVITSPFLKGTVRERGGAGSGRASCIGGATFNHRQKSTTPLKLMQIAKKRALTRPSARTSARGAVEEKQ